MIDRLAAAGFGPYLFIPGYFERKLARQLQIDGVFMRDAARASAQHDRSFDAAPAAPTSSPVVR